MEARQPDSEPQAAELTGSNGQQHVATPQAAPRRRSRRPFVLGTLVGLVLGAVATFVLLVQSQRDRSPLLTQAEFDAASTRWEQRGPASYDLDLELSGNRPGVVHVEVRRGEATHMVRDGVEPSQRRTWFYWTVPGQLDTIGQELEKAADPVAGFHAPPGARVIQRAQFDPELGYPLSYRRIILGSDLEIGWRVTKFAAVHDTGDAKSGPSHPPAQ